MTEYWVNEDSLTSLASAIRSKASISTPLTFPSGFISAIDGISAPYYSIYQNLAYRSVMSSGYPGLSEWINTLSSIGSGQFAETGWSGSYTFANVTSIDEYAFARLYIVGQTGLGNLTTFVFPKCTTLKGAAFANNRNGIASVYFPLLGEIGSYAFCSCASLVTLSFPNCTSIGACAFSACHSLNAVNFPSCATISNSAFYSCSRLATVSFPACTFIGQGAFTSCRSLISADFSNCVTISGFAFNSCSNLTAANFPSCTTIGGSAFYNCTVLSSVNFPSCATIGGSAFTSCHSLSTITLSNCTIIGAGAFMNCSSLSYISLPKCTSIGGSAFYSCKNLESINLPVCSYIGNQTFQYCSKLSAVYLLYSSVISGNGNSYMFYYTPISNSTYLGYFGSIYVPSSLYDAYRTATNWAVYSSRFVSLTDAQISAILNS